MVRGKRRFKCDRCKSTFIALDIELAATVFSIPQKCPVCGSMHTYPCGPFGLFAPAGWLLYKSIWKRLDEENNAQK
jgi:transposase-like protein